MEGEQLAAGAHRVLGLLREVGAALLKLVGLAHFRLVASSCRHFSRSFHCGGFQ